MPFIPQLNLNKHPSSIKDGAMIDAMNMMISEDNTVIRTEYGTTIRKDIIDSCLDITGYKHFIFKFAIPCNKELVLVIQNPINDNHAIIRYNEETNTCTLCNTSYKYSGGDVSTTFTYNKNELIIAIAESNNGKNTPLKVMNLGEFGKPKTYTTNHTVIDDVSTICPSVRIPECYTEVINGIAKKGWYFVFIRYKLDVNTYTPWYNTNASAFVDSFTPDKFFNLFTSKDAYADGSTRPNGFISFGQVDISDTTEIAKTTFFTRLKNIDRDYKHYQLGFVCMGKSYTNAYKTDDIEIRNDTVEEGFLFKKDAVHEYDVAELVRVYNNYYNVKSIISSNNRLYIGNYEEKDVISNSTFKDILLTINLVEINRNWNQFQEFIIDEDNFKIGRNNILGSIDDQGTFVDNGSLYGQEIFAKIPDDNKHKAIQLTAICRDKKFYIRGTDMFGVDKNGVIVSFDALSNRNNNGKKFTYIYKNDGGYLDVASTNMLDFLINPDDKKNFYGIVNREEFNKLKTIDSSIWTNSRIHIDKYKGEPSRAFNSTLTLGVSYGYSGSISTLLKDKYGVSFSDFNDCDFIITHINENKIEPIKVNMSKYVYMTKNYYDYNKSYVDNGIISKDDYTIDFSKYNSANIFNSVGIIPYQEYNFFIHFIDKHGVSSKGIPIKEFNVKLPAGNVNIKRNDNCISIIGVDKCDKIYNLEFTINTLPIGIEGYFVSYEAFESRVKHKGILVVSDMYVKKFYSDELNYKDKIDFEFDTLTVYKTEPVRNAVSFGADGQEGVHIVSQTYNKPAKYIIDAQLKQDYNKDKITTRISSKTFLVADAYNNVLNSTCIVLDTEKFIDTGVYIAELGVDEYITNYVKKNKKLIPCSPIVYGNGYDNKNISVKVNTKNGFVSKAHALIFSADKCYFNSTTKTFNSNGNGDVIDKPVIQYTFYDYFELPHESISYNNKPDVVFFPNKGLNSTNPREKSFVIGSIVECKNTVDLYKQKHFTIGECYPKPLEWRNPDIKFIEVFDKTIRRSNTIQDESYANRWYRFNQEDYKNIIENKGSITKMITFGNIFFVHTKHSMFEFNDNDTIKSNNGNIQLANIDIWDIKYRELLTSELGYAGLSKPNHSIDGEFGYIFYDADGRRLYRYDNGSFKPIDEDVRRYLPLYGQAPDINFINDKNNNRLIIQIEDTKNKISDVISYNYMYNVFISRHSYRFTKAYNTRANTYLIGKDGDASTIVQYDNRIATEYNGLKDTATKAYIHTITNTNYTNMKFIEYIKYKLRDVNVLNSIINDAYFSLPVEGTSPKYAADNITIASEFCSTGRMDIHIKNYNTFDDYKTPYWRMGNWHFDYIRDGITEYDNNKQSSDDSSRIYGNWFTVKFEFNRGKIVEFENIEYKLTLDISE